jgi:hypothetical protein
MFEIDQLKIIPMDRIKPIFLVDTPELEPERIQALANSI